MDPDDGSGSLLSLKESGVGAIYLGNIATPFTIKDDANSELGQVKASGIYLAEQGGVGRSSSYTWRFEVILNP